LNPLFNMVSKSIQTRLFGPIIQLAIGPPISIFTYARDVQSVT